MNKFKVNYIFFTSLKKKKHTKNRFPSIETKTIKKPKTYINKNNKKTLNELKTIKTSQINLNQLSLLSSSPSSSPLMLNESYETDCNYYLNSLFKDIDLIKLDFKINQTIKKVEESFNNINKLNQYILFYIY